MFGSPAPAPAGLFGAPAPAPGGLFGAPAAAPSGLFGAPAPAAGGLFGSPAAAPAFGAPPAPGGLFGAPAPAPGGFGGFGAPPAAGMYGAPPQAAGGLFGSPPPAAPAMGLYGAPAAPAAAYGAPAFASPMGVPANIIPPAADAALQQQLAAVEYQKQELEKLEVWRGKSPYSAITVPTSLAESNTMKVSPYSEALSTYRASPKSTTKIRPRGFGMNSISSPMASSSFGNRGSIPVRTPSSIAASSAKRLTIKPEAHTPKPSLRLRLTNGSPSGGATLLMNGVTSPAAVEKHTSPMAVQSPPVVTMKEGSPSGSGKERAFPTDTAHNFYNQVVGSPKPKAPQAMNRGYAPKLTKEGYTTTPSLSEMASRSEADLAALSAFSVSRDGYGSVAWEGTVDVRGIDLDSIVSIEHQDVAVYEDQEAAGTKPSVGEKLNRPAVISLYKTFAPKGGANASAEVKEKFAKKLEKACGQMSADFISYDQVRGIWKFRVHHFSRYGLYADDSDDEEEEEQKVTATTVTEKLPFFEAGERGGRSLVLEKTGSPTRFMVPRDDDDDDVEMMAEEEIVVVSDRMDSVEIQNSAEVAYKAMFLSPRAEPVKAAVIEDEDEEDVFADEATYVFPPQLPVVEPPTESDMMITREGGICSRIMAEQRVSASSVDMGIRMGRSFRVGWRPDGSFLHMASGSVLVQSRPKFSEEDSTNTCLLDVHSSRAKQNGEKGFTMPGPSFGGLKNAVQEMVAAIRASGEDSYSNSALTQAFALLLCLLNTKEESSGNVALLTMADSDSMLTSLGNIQTMEAFRRWLKESCAATVKTEIATARQRGDVHGAIFAALTSGDTIAAAAIATDNGYLQLAAMVTAGASASEFIREQVRQWHETGASSKIPPILLRIYTLLGGDFGLEEKCYKDGDESCDWMRRLGLLLTYGTNKDGGDYDFSSLVEKYDGDVTAGLAPKPEPLYARSAVEHTGAKSLLYSIIRLCNAIAQGLDEQVPLADIVQPLGHTPSQHDFSGAFQLASVLSALNCCAPLTETEQARLLSGYASQLVCAGKWEFAVYVMLSSVGETSLRQWRLKQAKNIILQNYSQENKVYQRFLTEKTHVPNVWLEEALADRFANTGNLFAYVSHLKEVSSDGARAALEESLVPNILFQNAKEATESLNMLKALLPMDESLTATIIQFFDLSFAIREVAAQPVQERFAHIQELQAVADSTEASLARHKAALENLACPSVPRSARIEVPMACFLAESLSGLSFLKLQLRTLESGSSIWDESSGGAAAPMKLASQLVADSEVVVKSKALKGYF